jgi:hypothetical protein
MDAMNVDPLSPLKFGAKYAVKYKEDYHREATGKEVEDAYEKYKDFYVKYHQDHPAAITDCYEEFVKTLGKQGKQTRLLGG